MIYISVIVKEERAVDFESLQEKYCIEKKRFFYTVSQRITLKNLKTFIRLMSKIVNGQKAKEDHRSLPNKLLITGINGNVAEECTCIPEIM